MMDENKRLDLTLIALESNLRHNGGTPSTFLETLADVIEREDWEKLGITFRELIELKPPKGIGSSEKEIMKVIQLKHRYEDIDKPIAERMAWLRREVTRLLDGKIDNHGTNQHSRTCGPQVLDYGSNDTRYIRARLKRDEPTLYQQVVDGVISPNKAGQKAGFIKPRQKFVPNDVGQTISALEKHFDSGKLVELAQELARRYL